MEPDKLALPPGFTLDAAPTQAKIPAGFVIDDRTVDKERGARLAARSATGATSRPDDRLATLKKYYPDAQPYGDDNFVFTDPKTGRPTLYNPPGLDVGDVASVGPEISEMAGGIVGATLATPPAVAGAAPTAGTSLLTIPAGYGLGAAAGREGYSLLSTPLMGTEDTRGLLERLSDITITGGVNAVGGRIAELLGRGASNVAGPVVRAAKNRLLQPGTQAISDFATAGVTPSAGAVTGNRGVQMMEHALANLPGSASVMQRNAERQLADIASAVDDLTANYGQRLTKEALGRRLQNAATTAGERFAARRNVLDDQLETAIGSGTRVPVPNVTALRQQLQAQAAQAPNSRGPVLDAAIKRLQALEADAAQGGVPFGALRAVRTDVGQMLERPDVTGWNPAAAAGMRRVYAALAQDIQAAAESAGPAARRALALHDRYVRFNRNVNLPILDDLAAKETPEQAYRYAMGFVQDGGSRLTALRRNVPDAEWNDVAATVLGRLGRTRGFVTDVADDVGEFSPATFMTEFKKLSPEARAALFGGTRYAELTSDLNRLARVMDRVGDVSKMANTSGTARVLGAMFGIYAAGDVVTGGDPVTAAGKVATFVIAPRVAARLLTNPRFVRWMASTVSNRGARPGIAPAELARLALVAKAEPEIRDEVRQYLDALRGQESATAAPPDTMSIGAGAATGRR
jgi:hypothetical protein